MIIDTHAHYDDNRFSEDLDQVLQKGLDNGIKAIITCATDFNNVNSVLSLCEKYKHVYGAIGIYPHETHKYEWSKDKLKQLAKSKKIVAIGEIGLDYYYDDSPKETQLFWARNQIELANELNLPISFHDRDAHADTIAILKELKPKGVIHCFSGSAQMAKDVIKLGMYIGIGGVVTFKNARVAVEVVEEIPLEKIVLETDAPYMSPVPFRGKRNQSDYINYTAGRIAEIKNTSLEEVLKITAQNAVELFKLDVKL